VTEVLFFGGLFTLYAVYHWKYPAAFAEAGNHLYLSLGATNLTVLLVSSLTVALAVHAVQSDDRKRALRMLLATFGLGCLFMVFKGTEYYLDFHDKIVPGAHFRGGWTHDSGHVQLFYILYFIMTGLHATHVLVGLGVLAVVIAKCAAHEKINTCRNMVEMFGLYWHFVDCVRIVLFPLLYLGGH
jgi:cytochrome c oxidase subunit 3